MTIEVDDRTAKLIAQMREQARARGLSLAAYLETVLKADQGVKDPAPMSAEEFEQALRDLAADLPALDPLPADFSRADIYIDHD